MKYATLRVDGTDTLAVLTPAGWCAMTDDTTMLEMIAGTQTTPAPEALDGIRDAQLPYRPGTILGVGLNYRDTVREMNWAEPQKPFLFPKLSSSAIGPYNDIVVDDRLTQRADWEGELAVIIGKFCRNVTAERASEVIFGYTAANDISARDLQEIDGQWLRGKGLDTFCPLGPVVVTADEIRDPQALRIVTSVNGRVVQDGTTSDMIFGVNELVSYCSTFFTLSPGDIILTGTPAGCGDFRTPPESLHAGDLVEVDVEGIGRLRNLVVAPR